jgi:hypothetical protein
MRKGMERGVGGRAEGHGGAKGRVGKWGIGWTGNKDMMREDEGRKWRGELRAGGMEERRGEWEGEEVDGQVAGTGRRTREGERRAGESRRDEVDGQDRVREDKGMERGGRRGVQGE